MQRARTITVVAAAAAGLAILAPPGRAARPDATLAVGDHGVAVAAVERRLADLGYLAAAAADGTYDETTWHAVVAFQGCHGLHRDGISGPQTRAALATATRPRPWGTMTHGLEIDVRRQVLLIVARSRVVRVIHVSTAATGYRTPTGSYRVYRREPRSWSWKYRVWLPYALYFTGGYALHAYPSVPAVPASHGCIRLPNLEAAAVYAATPVGTTVLVR